MNRAFRRSELRDHHPLAALHGRLVGADADHRPVGAGRGVGQGGLLAEDGHEEVVDEVRVGAAVAAALEEGQVLLVLEVVDALV